MAAGSWLSVCANGYLFAVQAFGHKVVRVSKLLGVQNCLEHPGAHSTTNVKKNASERMKIGETETVTSYETASTEIACRSSPLSSQHSRPHQSPFAGRATDSQGLPVRQPGAQMKFTRESIHYQLQLPMVFPLSMGAHTMRVRPFKTWRHHKQ